MNTDKNDKNEYVGDFWGTRLFLTEESGMGWVGLVKKLEKAGNIQFYNQNICFF